MAEQALSLVWGQDRDSYPTIIVGALEPRALGEVAQAVTSAAGDDLEVLAQNIVIARSVAADDMPVDAYWEDLGKDIVNGAEYVDRTCRQLDLGKYSLRKSGLAIPNPHYTSDQGLKIDQWLWVRPAGLREARVDTGSRTEPAGMPDFARLTMRLMFREQPKANEIAPATYDLTTPGSTVPRFGSGRFGRRY